MAAANHVFSAFSFITLILVLVPLPWHLEGMQCVPFLVQHADDPSTAWNMGTVIYMGWTSVSLLIYFINSVVWDGNIDNVAPVWCDISEVVEHFHCFKSTQSS
jgi:pheromone a factor receptor